jgi:tetratricopeptide (TPR) repeat protein
MTYLDLHNWREARNYFKDSVELSVRLGLDEIASVARLEHAETNLRLGRVEEAKPDIEKALAQCERRNDPLGTATAYRLQAIVAVHEGDHRLAEEHLQRSIELLRSLGETPHLGLALKERGRLRLEAGDGAAARSSLEEARRIFESLQVPHEGLDEVNALWELCLKASG